MPVVLGHRGDNIHYQKKDYCDYSSINMQRLYCYRAAGRVFSRMSPFQTISATYRLMAGLLWVMDPWVL